MKFIIIKKYLPFSIKKIQKILKQIQYKTYKEALIILEFMPFKACHYIWELIYNIAINSTKKNFITNNLYITEAISNKGPIKKKLKFIAKGRCSIIKKKTCHIRLTFKIL